jgi:polygalacturonase
MYCPSGAPHCFQPCNEDGVDVEGCSGVIIRDSDIYSHDDAIALKSGRNPHKCNQPTEHVLIENCSLTTLQAAIALGSETSGGIRDIVVKNVRVALPGFHGTASPPSAHTQQAINVKSERTRGDAAVEGLYVDGLIAGNVDQLIQITMQYHTGIPPQPKALTPIFRNFSFRNMRALSSGAMVWTGLPESPVRHVLVHNVSIDVYDAHFTECEYMADLNVSALVANGRDITLETMSTCAGFPPPLFEQEAYTLHTMHEKSIEI